MALLKTSTLLIVLISSISPCLFLHLSVIDRMNGLVDDHGQQDVVHKPKSWKTTDFTAEDNEYSHELSGSTEYYDNTHDFSYREENYDYTWSYLKERVGEHKLERREAADMSLEERIAHWLLQKQKKEVASKDEGTAVKPEDRDSDQELNTTQSGIKVERVQASVLIEVNSDNQMGVNAKRAEKIDDNDKTKVIKNSDQGLGNGEKVRVNSSTDQELLKNDNIKVNSNIDYEFNSNDKMKTDSNTGVNVDSESPQMTEEQFENGVEDSRYWNKANKEDRKTVLLDKDTIERNFLDTSLVPKYNLYDEILKAELENETEHVIQSENVNDQIYEFQENQKYSQSLSNSENGNAEQEYDAYDESYIDTDEGVNKNRKKKLFSEEKIVGQDLRSFYTLENFVDEKAGYPIKSINKSKTDRNPVKPKINARVSVSTFKARVDVNEENGKNVIEKGDKDSEFDSSVVETDSSYIEVLTDKMSDSKKIEIETLGNLKKQDTEQESNGKSPKLEKETSPDDDLQEDEIVEDVSWHDVSVTSNGKLSEAVKRDTTKAQAQQSNFKSGQMIRETEQNDVKIKRDVDVSDDDEKVNRTTETKQSTVQSSKDNASLTEAIAEDGSSINKSEATSDKNEHQLNNSNSDRSSEISGEKIILKEAERVNVSADYIPLVPAEISIMSDSFAPSEKIVRSVQMEKLASDLTTISSTTTSGPKSTDNVTPRESDSLIKTDRNENETNDQSVTETATLEVKTTESRPDLQNGEIETTGRALKTDPQHLMDVLKNVTKMEHEIIDIVVRGSLGANNSSQQQPAQNNSADGQKGSDREQDKDHNVQAGGQTVAEKVSLADLTSNRQDNGTENNTKPKTENSQTEKHNNSDGNSDGKPVHDTNENITALISETVEGETSNKPSQSARQQTHGVDPSPSIKNGSVMVSKTATNMTETVPFTGDSREMHEDLDGVEPLPSLFASSQGKKIPAANGTSESRSGDRQDRETSFVVGTESAEGDSTSITNKSADMVNSSQSQSDSTGNDSDSVSVSESDAAEKKLPETTDQQPVAYKARVPKGKVKRNANGTNTANNITDKNIIGNDTLNSRQTMNDMVSPVNGLRQKDTAKINETTSSVDVEKHFPTNTSGDLLAENQTDPQSNQSVDLKTVHQGSMSRNISEAHTSAEFNKSMSVANNGSQSTSRETLKESTSETTSTSPKIIHILSAPKINSVNTKDRNYSISRQTTSRSLQNETLDNNDDDIVQNTNNNNSRLQTASKINKTVISYVGDAKKISNRNKDKRVASVNRVKLSLSDDPSNLTDSNTTEDSVSPSLDEEPPSNYTTTSKTSRKLFSIEEESDVVVVNDANTVVAGMNDSSTARSQDISRAKNDTVKPTSAPSLRDLLSSPSDTASESRNITSPNSSISSINRNTSSMKTTIISSHPNKTSSSLSDTTMKPNGTSKESNTNDTINLQLLQENFKDSVKAADGSTEPETKQSENREKPNETQNKETASGHLQNTKRTIPGQVTKEIAGDDEQGKDKSIKEVVDETASAENSQVGPVTHGVEGKKRGDQPDSDHLSNGPGNMIVHNNNNSKDSNSSKNNNSDEGNNSNNNNNSDSKNDINDINTDQMARAESKLTSREIDMSNYRDTRKSNPTENNPNKMIQISKENNDDKEILDEKSLPNDIKTISITKDSNDPDGGDIAIGIGQDDNKPLTDSIKNDINNNNDDNKSRSSTKRSSNNNKIVFTSDILQSKSAGSHEEDPSPKAASNGRSGLKRENSNTQNNSSAKFSSNSSRIQTDKINTKKSKTNDESKDKKHRNQSSDGDVTSADKSPQTDVKRQTIQAEAATRDSVKKEYDPVNFLRTVGGLPYFGSAAASVAIPETSAYKVQDFSLSVQKEEPKPQNRQNANNNNNNYNNKDKNGNDNKNEEDNANGPGDCDEAACGLDTPLPLPRAQAAVSAVLTTHFGPTKDKMVPFDLELLDLADNYDNTTGMFICTIPGTYVISLYLMSHPGAKVNARVFINNRPIAALWADDSKNAGFYPSSSTQTIAQLGFGDQVYVMLVDGGYGDSWVHANYNVFTIFLLYEQIF